MFKRGDTVAQEKILYFIELILSFYTNSIECNVKISLYLLLCHFQAEQTINLLLWCLIQYKLGFAFELIQ